MGPNAPINKMTYQAGQQNRKWLSEAAQHAATKESPEPTCQGVTEGLGDLRFPLRARPVSAEGWVGGWCVALRGLTDMGGRKVLTSHTNSAPTMCFTLLWTPQHNTCTYTHAHTASRLRNVTKRKYVPTSPTQPTHTKKQE